jgi:DNA-binding IclR family transcriptional regulator
MSHRGELTHMTSNNSADLTALLNRLEAEYLEMPGLRLTPAQAARLLGADVPTCEQMLAQLAAEGFLVRAPAGWYCIAGEGWERIR